MLAVQVRPEAERGRPVRAGCAADGRGARVGAHAAVAARQPALGVQQLGVEDGPAGRAADRVVAQHDELDAVPVGGDGRARLDAADRDRHPAAERGVAARLRVARVVEDDDGPGRGRRQVQAGDGRAPRAQALGDVLGRGRAREADRDGLGVTVDDGHARALRRDDDVGLGDAGVGLTAGRGRAKRAEDLARLGRHFLLLAADERHDVAQDVQRGHARVARARECLHRDDVDRLDAEGVVQRPQRDDETDRRAVRVGHDAPGPAVHLAVQKREVVRVDFGHEQRHVRLHAVVAGVRDDDVAAARGLGLGLAGHGRVEAREEHVARQVLADEADRHRGDGRVQLGVRDPVGGLVVALAGRALARGEGRDLEEGVAGEQPHERLPDGPGRAEDAGPDSGPCRRDL